MRGFALVSLCLASLACSRSDDRPASSPPEPARPASAGSGSSAGSGTGSAAVAPARIEQVTPPVDVKAPPSDATKTATGLIYKKLATNESGALIKRNDTVMIHYTGWRQRSGETFFTTRGREQPMPLNLSQTAPGFTEALQLLRTGEKAMLWIPPEIGYKSPPTSGEPETLVYQVEVADVAPAPAIPDNVGKPPDKAEALPSGTKLVRVRPGTGKDKPRQYDTVTFNYTAWDAEGRMVDSTETRKRAVTAPPYKQPVPMMEALTAMTAGERARFWASAEKMRTAGKPVGGVDTGLLCYEIEVLQIAKAAHDPPPTPPDVAKPPDNARKTAKGVYYRVLKQAGKSGEHPNASSTVKVKYTGWTTDGRMFDSSFLKGEPTQFNLGNVVAGWTDGLQVMTEGDLVRFWIPEQLAYQGKAGKPEGMLVFDVELVEILPLSPH
jgi:peptidylprolyl isomerase